MYRPQSRAEDEERIVDSVRSGAAAVAPIRLAATVALLRDGAQGLEVACIRRRAEERFLGGGLAFPGGKVQEGDLDGFLPSDIDPPLAAARLGDAPQRAQAMCVAAIRECLEEVGVLLSTPAADGATTETLQAATPDGAALAAGLRERGLVLRASALVPFMRVISPRFEPRRSEVVYFLALAPEGAALRPAMDEIAAAIWLRPADALDLSRRGELVLLPPTHTPLEVLADCRDAAEALAAATHPVPSFEPVVEILPEGDFLFVYPGDPLHPEPALRLTREGAPPRRPPASRFLYREGRWTATHATGAVTHGT